MNLSSTKALLLLLSTAVGAEGARKEVSRSYKKKSALSIHSMPPNPNPYQITYADGTKSPLVKLVVEGDELNGDIWEETLDGYTVTPVEGGKYYAYLDFDEKAGKTVVTDLIAGVDDPKKAEVHKNAFKRAKSLRGGRGGDGERKLRGSGRQIHDEDQEAPHRRTAITSGTLKNLVIPFKFSDHVSRPLPTQAELSVLMSNEGPDPLCPTGSVRDVYLQNSFGALDLQSTVIDWVTLDFTEADCAGNQSGLYTGIHTCLTNALDKAVAAGVNFGDYDLDNNGVIDGITFFHSGYAAEWGGIDSYGTGQSGRIWSHKWAIHTTNWNSNGVRVYEYHINPSLWSTSGSNIGRIGVVAHETGHFLGLPDLYDYGPGSGIGSWGLMANSWGFDSSQYYPPIMSAWSKYELGWTTPINVSSSGTYSLSQTCDSNDMIIIDAGYPNGEYLLIENRQPCGFDRSMNQGGLAIFHIDEYANNVLGYPGQSGWPGNGDHYEVALLQADGDYDLEKGYDRGDSFDAFHGDGVNSIGPLGTSEGNLHPNTKAYQRGVIIDTEVTITNISPAGSTMTFDIIIGPASPTKSPAPTPMPSPHPSVAPTTTHGPTVEGGLVRIVSNQYPNQCITPYADTIYLQSCASASSILYYDNSGIIRSDDNLCLEVNPSTQNSATPTWQPCNGSVNQKWSLDEGSTTTIRPEYFSDAVCLDENGSGADVYQWTCDGSGDQYFNLRYVNGLDTPAPSAIPSVTTPAPSAAPTISSMPSSEPNPYPILISSNRHQDYCITPYGDTIHLKPCTEPSAVLTYDDNNHFIQSGGSCLAANPSGIDGAYPSWEACNGSVNQKWSFVLDEVYGTTIRPELFDDAVCLDENSVEASIYQWNCDGTTDQFFTVRPLSTTPTSEPSMISETEPPSKVPSMAPTASLSMAPSLPPSDLCDVMNVMGQTIYVAGPPGACWRIQLARGGTLEGDFSDPSCEKDESKWESNQGVFSKFRNLDLDDDTAYFAPGDNGYSGTFQFKEDPTLTKPALELLGWDPANQEFKLQVTIPTCSADAMCPTMKVEL